MLREDPQSHTFRVEIERTYLERISIAERFNVSEVLLRLDDDEFGLSSDKESDMEGIEVHGYLPAPSEIPERKIGGAHPSSRALSAC